MHWLLDLLEFFQWCLTNRRMINSANVLLPLALILLLMGEVYADVTSFIDFCNKGLSDVFEDGVRDLRKLSYSMQERLWLRLRLLVPLSLICRLVSVILILSILWCLLAFVSQAWLFGLNTLFEHVRRGDQVIDLLMGMFECYIQLAYFSLGYWDVTLSLLLDIIKIVFIEWVFLLKLYFKLDILWLNAAQLDSKLVNFLRLLCTLFLEVCFSLFTNFVDTCLPLLLFNHFSYSILLSD